MSRPKGGARVRSLPVNLARLGEDCVQTWGEYVSLAFEGREWTNVEQQHAANRFAHALRRLGVKVATIGCPTEYEATLTPAR